MIVLIPAYQPDMRLARLVLELHRADPKVRIIVVDDGSGPHYSVYFTAAQAAGATIVTSARNRGKGRALRAGIAKAIAIAPGEVVVTADADGQHEVGDILAVGRRAEESGRIVLGARSFGEDVPARSRFGNRATAVLFRLATGVRLCDTQTGLRAFPSEDLLWLLDAPGDRYEYELSVLLRAAESRLPLEEIPIATIYEEGNPTSHFRPIRDSARIYPPLLAFSASSIAGFVVDYLGVLGLNALLGGILVPVLGARILSAGVNFALNRRVFRAARGSVVSSAVKYAALALALVGASSVGIFLLTRAGLALWAAKPLVDVVLYLASYRIQRRLVFTECEGRAKREPADPAKVPAEIAAEAAGTPEEAEARPLAGHPDAAPLRAPAGGAVSLGGRIRRALSGPHPARIAR